MDPAGRAAFVWILGQYGERIQVNPQSPISCFKLAVNSEERRERELIPSCHNVIQRPDSLGLGVHLMPMQVSFLLSAARCCFGLMCVCV